MRSCMCVRETERERIDGREKKTHTHTQATGTQTSILNTKKTKQKHHLFEQQNSRFKLITFLIRIRRRVAEVQLP